MEGKSNGKMCLIAVGIMVLSFILVQSAFAQVVIMGDVDSNGVVTCRDVALAKNALGILTGEPGFLVRADINGNGRIDNGDIEAISRLLPVGAICEGVTNYLIVDGHDGYPDPDDNLAQLAAFYAIRRASQRNPRVAYGGLVFGDTTSANKAGMINPVTTNDFTSRANWEFHEQYNVPVLMELGLTPETHADVVTEQWNFTPTSPDEITSGGRLLFVYVKAAIDANGMDRVVYTAGGGHHAPAEAIALLRYLGYSDSQILEHFAVVQHSRVNWTNFTEATAREITLNFSIRIDDQNGSVASGRLRSGPGFPPETVSPTCTSPAFAEAWYDAAVCGEACSGIPNHRASRDASDSGEAAFASTPTLMDQYWYTRGVGLSLDPSLTARCNTLDNQAECIVYDAYSTPQMNANMNCSVEFSDFLAPVDNLPTMNVVKAGATVPAKFSVSDFEGSNVLDILQVISEPISCESGEALGAPSEVAISAGDSSVRYDASASEYQFDWKTDKSWSDTCRQLQVWRDSGVLTANFKFK